MSTHLISPRMRAIVVRSLPWLMGLTIGAAIIYLQNAGYVRKDREVLLQVPRALPSGYSGTVGARVFVYVAADSGDPELLAPPATLSLLGPDGRIFYKKLTSSAVGGLEVTIEMPEPLQKLPLAVELAFELEGEEHILHGVIEVANDADDLAALNGGTEARALEVSIPNAEGNGSNADGSEGADSFMPRFGGCVAGRLCANAHEHMTPWPAERWSALKQMPTLPRYAIAVERAETDERGARLFLACDGALAIDSFSDRVWTGASSQKRCGAFELGRRATSQRVQFRPDPFDVGAASTFDLGAERTQEPSVLALAKQEAQVYRMPSMWSWRAQREAEAQSARARAKTFFVVVVIICALGAVALLLLRWKATRPTGEVAEQQDAQILFGRTIALVAGAFAFALLFLTATALYLMRDFLGF